MNTVDLSKNQKEGQTLAQKAQMGKKRPEPIKEKVPEKKKKPMKRYDIDEVFNPAEEVRDEKYDARNFSRPKSPANNEQYWKMAVFALLILVVGIFGYMKIFPGKENGEVLGEAQEKEKWYAVKLVNNEEYYGQIGELNADPIVIKNVYYNYDQVQATQPVEGEKTDGNRLRLIKRGKETHGPAGSMNIVRAQVVYMEELSTESKVLQAILDYEK